MGQVGKYLRRIGAGDGHTARGYAHWCPACQSMHAFAVDAPFSNGAKWTFDGNIERPSFSPSMNIRIGRYADPEFVDEDNLSSVCHYFLQGGVLKFCGDSTHALRGQSVPLPELPESLRDR
jgi:hypothetical protein